ncbi:MAG: alpha/beta hydrolase [Phycicoccus sp.]|nr:alpha/beta hydrolase [Phycicoccus sp.]NMM34295.1 alpha/beta hydrolase [Phycicoccus sp.]
MSRQSPPARTKRVVGVLAASLAVMLAGSACAVAPGGQDQARTPDPAQKSSAQALPPDKETLARFYTQDLAWSKCGPDQCAKLTVPIDYSHPDGDTIKLAVLRALAKSPSKRIGSLVVNPGGPGGSGVNYARAADYIVTPAVRAAYDIVGFDPRGVGSSSPIKCLNDRELDTFLGSDPTPDNQLEEQQFAEWAKAFADKCKATGGPLLGHVSTIDAAKDMDVLRAALGETKLDYLGKSYGTFLGATYADLFPTKVGRFVLDGAIDPNLTSSQVNEGQAVGFETATRAYVQDCVGKGGCPLGDSLSSGMQRLRDFLKQVDAKPLPLNDPYVHVLTEGWASLGVAVAMYDPGLWSQLTDALRSGFGGNAAPLMKLADSYAYRNSEGAYSGNLMQVIYAVNCLDRSDSTDLAHYESEARSLSAKAPTWGPFLAWSTMPCGYWPAPANNAPKKVTAAGSGPIVVVGTTRDPATPYKWAQGLASELQNGHLITFNGDGHTAYTRSNSCVNDAVDAYLLKGRVPPDGLKC